jgi:hypothetical protein
VLVKTKYQPAKNVVFERFKRLPLF